MSTGKAPAPVLVQGIFIILVGYVLSQEEMECTGHWLLIHRSCYKFVTFPQKSWEDAQKSCAEEGANLLSIGSAEEKNKVKNELKQKITSQSLLQWWVGLRFNRISQEWKWLDGGALVSKITPFAPGEPNNGSGDEDCGELRFDIKLNDKSCNAIRPYICEKTKLTPPPTSSTVRFLTTTEYRKIETEETTLERNVSVDYSSDKVEATDHTTEATRNVPETTYNVDTTQEVHTKISLNISTPTQTYEPVFTTISFNTYLFNNSTESTKVPTTTKSSTVPPISNSTIKDTTREPKGNEEHGQGQQNKSDIKDYSGCYSVFAEGLCPSATFMGFDWPETQPGKLAKVSCPNKNGFATWKCRKQPTVCWDGEPDTKKCVSENIQIISDQASSIRNSNDSQGAIHFTEMLINAMEDTNDSLSQQDLMESTKLISAVAHIDSSNVTTVTTIIQNIARIGSNIVAKKDKPSWKEIDAATQTAVTSSLMQSVESTSVALVKNLNEATKKEIKTEKMAIELQVIDVDTMPGNNAEYEGSTENTVSLPKDVLDMYSSGGLARLVFITYVDIGDLLASSNKDTLDGRILSKVVSASVGNDGLAKLPKPISFTFKTDEMIYSHASPLCSFWNFSEGHVGAWSQEGCRRINYNSTHTTCECDHMTNFAILMDVHATEMASFHEVSLSYITYAGCIISIICLFFSWITFQFISVIQSERNSIHKHLVFCLFVAEIVFLAGIEQTGHRIVCGVIAGVLHYFFLASFTWMFVEGVHILFMLVQVFDSAKSRLKYYYLLGYGIPLVIVGVSAAIKYNGYGTDKHCWLSAQGMFIWSFAGPIAFIILVNSMILVYAMSTVCKHSEYVFARDKGNQWNLKGWIQGALALEVLLGLTWIFGYFYISQEMLVMAYLFTVFNSLQGLFIYIFHCLCNKKVRKEYKKCLHGSKLSRSSGVKSTGTASQGTGGTNITRKQSNQAEVYKPKFESVAL
ncbi:hypothetical protein CHS0354_026429 [Potamilus streckersoni]|uniref:Uncharacterized protein n=1 Tax=Potamilus streckersoni TaxID=2493646 RepID=A0AAE0RPY9_9BIVA|nr:hypothetical protein CHS0354_026429 [Potamilus streckersoni]